MKNKLELLEERLSSLNDILGELDISSLQEKTGRSQISKEKLKSIDDVIAFLQKEISDNEPLAFKDILKKCKILLKLVEELVPLFDLEKLRNEFNASEKEIYMLILSNEAELQKFCKNLSVVRDNQNILELNPITDGQEKILKLKPLEKKSMELETKVLQISQNVDGLLKNYNETVTALNDKFSLYDRIISNLPVK
jgi:hypothetical protein